MNTTPIHPMPKVLNKHHYKQALPKGSVYVGRPTKYGNPFAMKTPQERDSVVQKFKDWIYAQPELLQQVRTELKGKDLVCWCAPKACHADVLLEIANSEA